MPAYFQLKWGPDSWTPGIYKGVNLEGLGQWLRGARGTIRCARWHWMPPGGAERTNRTQLCQLNPGPVVPPTQAQGPRLGKTSRWGPPFAPSPSGGQGLRHVSTDEEGLLTPNTPSSRLWHLRTRDAIPAQYVPNAADSKPSWAG